MAEIAEIGFETPSSSSSETRLEKYFNKYWTINDFDLVTIVISTGSQYVLAGLIWIAFEAR